METYLLITNALSDAAEGVAGGSLVMAKVCAYIISAILVMVASYSIFAEIRAKICHEAPNSIEGLEPCSTKKIFFVDAMLLTMAAIIVILV